MGRAKTQVDDLTALRQATREAHEAVQSLNEARKAALDAKAELEATKQDLADMMVAIWDGKVDSIITDALERYLPTVSSMLEATESSIAKRIDRLVEVMLNPQENEVSVVIEELYGDGAKEAPTAVEQLIFNAAGVVRERSRGL